MLSCSYRTDRSGELTRLGVLRDVERCRCSARRPVEQANEVIAEALADGVKVAKRAVKPGRRAAEDLVDDA